MTEGRRVAVVGDGTSVAGFRPLGFAVFALSEPSEARGLWQELTGGEFAVVFVTEQVWPHVADLAADAADRAVPAVTVIPGAGSVGGIGQEKLDRAIERALGTTAFTREEDG
ncbi:MAG: V-type ATP synthase subunit F [Coriobacteriia bacterium]|nr:V-type ATP synthase subunit F [Coriobacteriia bacterium]